MKYLISLLVLFFSSSLIASNFYCFETHDKNGKMNIVNELLFNKINNSNYELSFPQFPEDSAQTFSIMHQDNKILILNLSGIIDIYGFSFNIIIDKEDLTFGSASLFNPFELENMELSSGYCRKL
tara:strand:+ start:2148 stop:2522 length:375 start_codon:yes stop_codon:yes gene_type:complete